MRRRDLCRFFVRHHEEQRGEEFLFSLHCSCCFLLSALHSSCCPCVCRCAVYVQPNCTCRILVCEAGLKHIVIIAKTPIGAGEEITYDYQFGIGNETDKLTCLCGARTCLGRMN